MEIVFFGTAAGKPSTKSNTSSIGIILNNNDYKNIANGIINAEINKQSKIKQIFVNCLVTIFDYKNKANYQ